MKFACQEHLVPGLKLPEKLTWLETNGFDGIELWAFDLKERMKSVKRDLLSSSIHISSLCGGYEGNLVDSSIVSRNKAMEGIKRLIEYAVELESSGVIIVPSFGSAQTLGVLEPIPTPTFTEVERFTAALAEIGDLANESQITILVEPINRYESLLFHKIEEIVDILQHINNPNLFVLGDFFHMNVEEEAVDKSLKAFISYIQYLHLSDSNRFVPGKGHLDFKKLIKILNQEAYGGYLSFECFIQHPDELIQSKNYLKQLWNDKEI